ncbi:DUF6524 family protein [Paucibacter sp. B2R-40]|jgi:hypothetical protein|uniref:DUF6524 family protein n=1 Tax=Paucibacter sp. B2R-40 TaxID=2893554 RepID=UPI0021E41834|nr:DUF6524 family protein [Paucibacter sp. B2R-40]MCV2353762.1 DUF6524 family protein [Paucibacter sp. B2R-40]
MAERGISWFGIGVRVVLGIALVLVTYNPSGHSFYHWLTAPPPEFNAPKAIAGVLLLIGWVVCLRTAYVALGLLGALLGGALLGSLVWEMVDLKWIDPDGTGNMAWLSLGALGILLGIGLSWSLIGARLTGQIEVK